MDVLTIQWGWFGGKPAIPGVTIKFDTGIFGGRLWLLGSKEGTNPYEGEIFLKEIQGGAIAFTSIAVPSVSFQISADTSTTDVVKMSSGVIGGIGILIGSTQTLYSNNDLIISPDMTPNNPVYTTVADTTTTSAAKMDAGVVGGMGILMGGTQETHSNDALVTTPDAAPVSPTYDNGQPAPTITMNNKIQFKTGKIIGT